MKALWGGELPEFDSLDAVNELLRILVMGLWHAMRSTGFDRHGGGALNLPCRRLGSTRCGC